MSDLDEAVQLIRTGQREEGRQMLEELLEADENNEEIWLWLSAVVESNEDREICLENVLAIDPNNAAAQRGLASLRAGHFNVNEMLGDLLEAEEESGVAPRTFIDDFTVGDQFGDDDELVMPGAMKTNQGATTARAAKRKKKGGGLNIRLIVLLALGLFLILALGSVAAFTLLSGGDETEVPGGTPPAQGTPAEGEAPPEAAPPTDTPTPAPTDIPTATFTPALQLPTPKPTDLPTPIATKVVSPTPPR
jgi:hypothetical protein